MRLVDVEKAQHWDSRGHFFAAAAEAMRRILVERIRRKRRLKHGSVQLMSEAPAIEIAAGENRWDDVLAVDAALDALGQEDPVRPSWSSFASMPG
ncbi:MAG: ECF-type sigma factor [Thermoguttaceae bacterium]